MKTKHTQGKLFADLEGFYSDTGIIIRSNTNWERQPIAEAYHSGNPDAPNGEESEANAKRLVKCWNMHDEMLTFIKEIARRYPNSPWIYKEANELIQKATE